MNEWEAVLLGIVEGLTEYLPVSSTGHLILDPAVAWESSKNEASNAYAICIQAGAILAVVGIYWQRMVQMVGGVWQLGRGSQSAAEGLRLASNIVAAFIPAAIVGVLFDDKIEELFFSLWYTVFAWFVGRSGNLSC